MESKVASVSRISAACGTVGVLTASRRAGSAALEANVRTTLRSIRTETTSASEALKESALPEGYSTPPAESSIIARTSAVLHVKFTPFDVKSPPYWAMNMAHMLEVTFCMDASSDASDVMDPELGRALSREVVVKAYTNTLFGMVDSVPVCEGVTVLLTLFVSVAGVLVTEAVPLGVDVDDFVIEGVSELVLLSDLDIEEEAVLLAEGVLLLLSEVNGVLLAVIVDVGVMDEVM